MCDKANHAVWCMCHVNESEIKKLTDERDFLAMQILEAKNAAIGAIEENKKFRRALEKIKNSNCKTSSWPKRIAAKALEEDHE